MRLHTILKTLPAFLLASVIALPAASAQEGPRSDFGMTPGVTPTEAVVDMPSSIKTTFRWNFLTPDTGNDVNLFGATVDYDYSFLRQDETVFTAGLSLFFAGTDLDNVESYWFEPTATVGVEWVRPMTDDLSLGFNTEVRTGFAWLNISSDATAAADNDLYYLPVEGVFGPRLYVGEMAYVSLQGIVGGEIGLDSEQGGTPTDFFNIGASLGVGLRF